MQAVKSICQKEGVRGMFAGYGSFLLRDLPFDAIEFVTYEQLRRAYKVSLAGSREVSGAETAVMGECVMSVQACENYLSSLSCDVQKLCLIAPIALCRRGCGRCDGHPDHALRCAEDAADDPGRQPHICQCGRLRGEDLAGGGLEDLLQGRPLL
jgi:Mitochondrial carrier protein